MTTGVADTVLLVEDAAKFLRMGKRTLVSLLNDESADLPKPFKLGRRNAWLESDLYNYVRRKASEANPKRSDG